MTGYGSLPQHWCRTCRQLIGVRCACGLPIPMQQWDEQPKQRSVIVTTLIVLFTVFILVPMLLMGGCAVLVGVAGLGSAVTP